MLGGHVLCKQQAAVRPDAEKLNGLIDFGSVPRRPQVGLKFLVGRYRTRGTRSVLCTE